MTARILIVDPQFQKDPDIERGVLGTEVDISVWHPSGHEVVPPDVLQGADIIVNCRSRHRLPAETVSSLPDVRLIVQAGVGFNHIDLEACGRAGIPVCNTPDYGTREVADHAIALMLSLARGVTGYDQRLRARAETWSTFALPMPPVRRLNGQVFGVVGLGRIGLAAALRAKAFEMDVIFHDPHLPPGAELSLGMRRAKRLDDLLRVADVVSIHCPLSDETQNLIDDRAIAAMKPGAVLINTARGGIVDLDAVERGLRSGHLAAAGLDVLPKEPADRSHPLIAAWVRAEDWLAGRLILTPHAAFYTPESLADMRRLSALAVHEFLTEGTLRSCVNLDALRRYGHRAG